MSYKDNIRRVIIAVTLAATATSLFAGCKDEEISGPDLYSNSIDEPDDSDQTSSSSDETSSNETSEPTSSSEPETSSDTASSDTSSEPEQTSSDDETSEPTTSEPTSSDETSEPTTSEPVESKPVESKPTQSSKPTTSEPKPTQSSKPAQSSSSQPTQSQPTPSSSTGSTQKYTPTDTTGYTMGEDGKPRDAQYFKDHGLTFVDQNGDKWTFQSGSWGREGTGGVGVSPDSNLGGQDPNAY